jgi:6-phosphogluconolactonase
MARLTIASDEGQLAGLAGERVTQLIVQAVADRGTASVALAGGTTPRRLYATLADTRQQGRDRIPWPQVHLFWGDERHVPPDHPDSNYGMAKAALLDHVPIPAEHVHRIRGELPDAHAAADDYERTLASVVSGFSRTASVASASPPSLAASAFRRKNLFDLMLLGLGEDAHIASIFPGSDLLEPTQPSTGRRVAAVWAPHLGVWRITLTPETVLEAQDIVVLVAGTNKADAVYAALEGPLDVKTYPAQLLRSGDDRVEWFLERAAASRL